MLTNHHTTEPRLRRGLRSFCHPRTAIVAVATTLVLGLAPAAYANPAPFWGGINTSQSARYATYGNDCTMAVGSVWNAASRPQAGATLVCNGSARHNVSVRAEYWAAPAGGNWTLLSDSGWANFSNVLYGMGSRTLYSQPGCVPTRWPHNVQWLAQVEVWIDGNHRVLPDAQGYWDNAARC
jgi:hypothetical protein